MRLPVLFVSVCVLVSAKPETYREKEDFEYSRSSTDEGSKSGYYGAQRGNMGGNYEHAHNMDLPAQHQMSTLVRQVDGELGTGSNTRTGSVFTSGSSRGIYGSGSYDLSNLKGRNFGENGAFGAQSHSSMSSGSASNFGYGHEHASSNSRYSSSQSQRQSSSSRFHSADQSSSGVVVDGRQVESLIGGASDYDNMGAKNNFRYDAQSSNFGNSDFEENAYNSNLQSHHVSGTPVKVYIRPSGRITIPVSVQTYDASHYNSIHDQNSVKTDAELLGSSGTGSHYNPITKHYESSYKYKKEWEKHDTQTIATPTENPFDRNSELYDSAHLSQNSNNQDQFTSNFDSSRHNSAQLDKMNTVYSNGYSSGSRSSSSHQAGLSAQSQNLEAASVLSGSTLEDINSRPKHYQSSYSYHKAWERQGDPYVIVPVSSSGASDLQTSQRLTAGSQNYGHGSSHQHGFHSQSHQSYSSGSNADCDEHGHIRVARSYNTNQKPSTYKDNFEQQSQSKWENIEDLGQHTQDKFTDLGQQTQGEWDNLGQQTQNSWGQLDNLSQQQQNKWENQDELEQNNHNRWEHIDQYPERKLDKIEDLGQQVENNDDNQHVQKVSHEYFGQHPQDMWGKANYEQSQGQFHNYGLNAGSVDQSPWHKFHFNQQIQNIRNINQQNMENGPVNDYINSYGKHLQNENLFGHNHDDHHSQAGLWTSNTQYNSWNSYAHGNGYYKQFSDFWNREHFNQNDWQHGSSLDSKQQSSETNNISNLWDKLEKLDKTLNTQSSNALNYNANINNFESTEKKNIANKDNLNSDVKNNYNNTTDESKQPMDIGRGDIGPEDSNNGLISADQHNDILTDSNNNKAAPENDEYPNLNKNNTTLNQNTTADALDINDFIDEQGVQPENFHSNTNSNLKQDSVIGDSETTVSNHLQHPSIIGNLENFNQHVISQHHEDLEQKNMEQQLEVFEQKNIDQQSQTFKQNKSQQLEDFSQQNVNQQLEDFNQQNTNQHVKDLSQQNIDQQLVQFGQQNTDQQLEQFSQQNTNQQLQEIGQQNTDQQLKDFSQQNTDQQLEDFSQQNTDQQLEQFGQQNTDQQLEQFSQPNTEQQLEQFEQQNTDQDLEQFGQQHTDQQFDNYSQPNTDQQLEDFGQQNTEQFGGHNVDQDIQQFGQQNMDQQLEDFSQQNTDQQLEQFGQQNADQQLEHFGQQNTDQQLKDFSHKNEDPPMEAVKQQSTGQHDMNQNLEEFSHHNMDQESEDLQSQTLEIFKEAGRMSHKIDKPERPTEVEVNHATNYNQNELQENPQERLQKENMEEHAQVVDQVQGKSPEVPVTEKPGFWTSVGSKLSKAKDSVAGWFKRS